ncbi:photosystem II stability/assembly factor-like uncharacterized protein [Bacillus pakistanensis]|uniref:Photosystem II stability/assembly factor-like uncharacterized protein n=1 Tax=Rossellomorea pakistanensis TaxID=992288 RepID=A0ABS2NIN6_9BACI|nr:VPS10, VPS10 domain protein [Bacillus pakistanensis]MBM7587396.1 photosystem II stability/assembly factor-like uncharacterized protein [Bacillus pakistanensis]
MKIINAVLGLLLVSVIFPLSVYAHGSEEEHKQEIATNTYMMYGMIISIVVIIIGLVLWGVYNKKLAALNKKKTDERKILSNKARNYLILSGLGLVLFIGTFIGGASTKPQNTENAIELMHIHGMGYSNDGKSLYIPAHDGLKVYEEGNWIANDAGEPHDYMGFSMVDEGFYSSGHPAPGSSMKNPFGILKSNDLGATLDTLDLYGEIDFHGMAVGYYSHAIYVFNPEKNSRMSENGLYYSLDEAKTWTKSEMNGLEGQTATLAVHPSKENIVVVSTNNGAYYSKDYGNNFEPLLNSPVTSVAFDNSGALYLGVYSGKSQLIKMDAKTKEQDKISIPSLKEEDAISYIAINPKNPREITFTTFKKDIYQTKESGSQWNVLAELGATSENKEKH